MLVADAGLAMAALVDDRAGVIGAVGVEHAHGDAVLHRGQERGGVEHPAAEVGELGGLVEAHHGDAAGRLHHAGIGAHHAIGVRPDLHLLGAQGGAHQGRREVAAVATHGGDLAGLGAADEAGDDRHHAGLDALGDAAAHARPPSRPGGARRRRRRR